MTQTGREPIQTQMVDVGEKSITLRTAVASGKIRLEKTVLEAVQTFRVPKGNVLEVARIAGIMAAKKTDSILPLCHPLPLEFLTLRFEIENDGVRVKAEVKTHAKTGVEMEALVAVSVACLTIYDMCKSLPEGQSASIESVMLEEKNGGSGGHYLRGTSNYPLKKETDGAIFRTDIE